MAGRGSQEACASGLPNGGSIIDHRSDSHQVLPGSPEDRICAAKHHKHGSATRVCMQASKLELVLEEPLTIVRLDLCQDST